MQMIERSRWVHEPSLRSFSLPLTTALFLLVTIGCKNHHTEGVSAQRSAAGVPEVPARETGLPEDLRGTPNAIGGPEKGRPRQGSVACPGKIPSPQHAPVYSSPPVVLNRAQFARTLREEYHLIAEQTTSPGVVGILFLVDTLGVVPQVTIAQSSGDPRLDSTAVRGVLRTHFHPAQLDGRPICMWVAVPIVLPPPDAMLPRGN